MNLKSSNTDPEIWESNIKALMPQKNGVGDIGEAIRSAAPWPCARRERRGKRTSRRQDLPGPKDLFLTLTPMPPTLPSSHQILPRSAADRFVSHLFSDIFSTSFLCHFGLPFGAPNHPKCPQALIQNRRSKNMCPIFGFGSFFCQFSTPMNPRK